eukprot:SAG31_NODE_21880_length_538_cov_1.701595_1_plen_80_part_01
MCFSGGDLAAPQAGNNERSRAIYCLLGSLSDRYLVAGGEPQLWEGVSSARVPWQESVIVPESLQLCSLYDSRVFITKLQS